MTERAVVAECWGPVHRGRATVLQWACTWIDAGGVVHRWDLTDHIVTGDREAATWTFEYTWQGHTDVIEGATVARSADGLIDELREFRTTAPPVDWTGPQR